MENNCDNESSFELNQPQSISRYEEFQKKLEMFSYMFAQSAKQCTEDFADKLDKQLVSCNSEILDEKVQNRMLIQQNEKFKERISRLKTEIQSSNLRPELENKQPWAEVMQDVHYETDIA